MDQNYNLAHTTQIGGIRIDHARSLCAICDLTREALLNNDTLLGTFVNPRSVCIAEKRPEFIHMLNLFDLVYTDGVALVMTARFVNRCSVPRISFDSTSLAPHIFHLAQTTSTSIVFVGGKQQVAEQAKANVEKAYPGINIVAAFDGYSDWEETLFNVLKLNPSIIICGMGGFTQEKFLLDLVERGWKGVGFTCGGYLDQLHKGMKYYPKFVDKANLRWMYRLVKEPRRLWKRYFVEYPYFVFLVIRKHGWTEIMSSAEIRKGIVDE